MDAHKCNCNGGGWIDNGNDYEQCIVHYCGQLHPDSIRLLQDDPTALQLEKKRAEIKYKLMLNYEKLSELQTSMNSVKNQIAHLELQLTNSTPTLRNIKAVIPEEAIDFSDLNDILEVEF
jgi:septal ring factor EnvC (AmiA/AmiB activator)